MIRADAARIILFYTAIFFSIKNKCTASYVKKFV